MCKWLGGKKKHWAWTKPMCTVHMGIFVSFFSTLVFSPFWEENFLVSPRENTWAYHLFSLSPSQPNTLQKKFPPHFLSFFFSFLPKIHSTKHPKVGFFWGGGEEGRGEQFLLQLSFITNCNWLSITITWTYHIFFFTIYNLPCGQL